MEYRGSADAVSVRRFAELLKSSKVTSSNNLTLATKILEKTVEETYQKGQDPKRVCATLGGFPITVTDNSIRCLSEKEAGVFKISAAQRQYITLNILKTAGRLFLSEKDASDAKKAAAEFSKSPSPAFWKICRVFWEAATRKNVVISLSLVISFALAFIALTSTKGHFADTLQATRSLFSHLDTARIRTGEGLSSFVERLSSWVKPDVQKLLRNLQEARASTERNIDGVKSALHSVHDEHKTSKQLMASHDLEADRLLEQAHSIEDRSFWRDLIYAPLAFVAGGLAGTRINRPTNRPPRGSNSNLLYASAQKEGESEAVAQIVTVLNGAKGASIDKTQVVNLVKRTFEQDYTVGTLPSQACGGRAVPLALVGAPKNPKIVCLDHETERRLGSILTPTMTTMLSLAVAEKASHVLADTSTEQAKLRRLAKEAFEKPAEKFNALVMAIYDIGKRNKIKLTVGFVGLLAVALIAKSNRFQNIQYLQSPLQKVRQAWDVTVAGASDLRSKMSRVFTAPQNWILSLTTRGREEMEKVRQLHEDIEKKDSHYKTITRELSDSVKALKDQDRLTELALGKKRDAEAVLSRARSMKEKGGKIALAAGVASGAMGLISGASLGRARTAEVRHAETRVFDSEARGQAQVREARRAQRGARASKLVSALQKFEMGRLAAERDEAKSQLQQAAEDITARKIQAAHRARASKLVSDSQKSEMLRLAAERDVAVQATAAYLSRRNPTLNERQNFIGGVDDSHIAGRIERARKLRV